MPDVLDYQRGPSEADRQAASQLSASRRDAIIVFVVFLLIALLAAVFA